MCVNNLLRVALDSGANGIRTHDLLIASPTPYRYATKPATKFGRGDICLEHKALGWLTTQPTQHLKHISKCMQNKLSL